MSKHLVIVESPTNVPILPKFYCYILKSLSLGSYYIGSSNDYNERLKLHNIGGVKSTKHARPWILVYFENFDALKEAKNRELQIKRWKSRRAIERLLNKI